MRDSTNRFVDNYIDIRTKEYAGLKHDLYLARLALERISKWDAEICDIKMYAKSILHTLNERGK